MPLLLLLLLGLGIGLLLLFFRHFVFFLVFVFFPHSEMYKVLQHSAIRALLHSAKCSLPEVLSGRCYDVFTLVVSGADTRTHGFYGFM